MKPEGAFIRCTVCGAVLPAATRVCPLCGVKLILGETAECLADDEISCERGAPPRLRKLYFERRDNRPDNRIRED
jgi:predicted RNA-binding Zn-ribbon protein involved in translation (DUF1610 family)